LDLPAVDLGQLMWCTEHDERVYRHFGTGAEVSQTFRHR